MNYKWERGKDGTAYPRAQAQSGQHSQGEHPVVYLWINQTCFPVLQDEVGAGDGAERGLGALSLQGDGVLGHLPCEGTRCWGGPPLWGGRVLGGTPFARREGVGGIPLARGWGVGGTPFGRGRVFGVYPPCFKGAGCWGCTLLLQRGRVLEWGAPSVPVKALGWGYPPRKCVG